MGLFMDYLLFFLAALSLANGDSGLWTPTTTAHNRFRSRSEAALCCGIEFSPEEEPEETKKLAHDWVRGLGGGA